MVENDHSRIKNYKKIHHLENDFVFQNRIISPHDIEIKCF